MLEAYCQKKLIAEYNLFENSYVCRNNSTSLPSSKSQNTIKISTVPKIIVQKQSTSPLSTILIA